MITFFWLRIELRFIQGNILSYNFEYYKECADETNELYLKLKQQSCLFEQKLRKYHTK